VSLRVRRPAGRKRVQMLVAYGVGRDGRRQLLAFLRSQGESQAQWEALLQDLYRRGLEGKHLGLIVTDGCPGLAAALQTVYPRVRHQRCWVHKMRNILEKVRRRDYEEVKRGAQAIYLAANRAQAEAAFRAFRGRWRREYGSMVRRLEQDRLCVSAYPVERHLWISLRSPVSYTSGQLRRVRARKPLQLVAAIELISLNRVLDFPHHSGLAHAA